MFVYLADSIAFMVNQSRMVRKIIEVSLHILIWVLVIYIPFLTFNHNGDSPHLSPWRAFWFQGMFVVVFYVNYFLLIPRLFFRKRMLLFFIANILLLAITTTASEKIRPVGMGMQGIPAQTIHHRQMQFREAPERQFGMIMRGLIAFSMTAGIAVAIHTTKQWFRSEEIRKDLQSEHLKSELANLKNQLNPHFFFNTLNNIYSLISQDQNKAQSAVHQLSKLMRYLLYDSNEKYVPLAKELDFMEHYIELMRLRVTNHVNISCNFPRQISGYNIAPLLFISLIENSFKHGISAGQPSEISMKLELREGETLYFEIKNSFFPKDDLDRSGSGIGIENLQKRLNLLYAGKHIMAITTENNLYITRLTIFL